MQSPTLQRSRLAEVVPSSLVTFGKVPLKAAVIIIRVTLVGTAHTHLAIVFTGFVAIPVIGAFITPDI